MTTDTTADTPTATKVTTASRAAELVVNAIRAGDAVYIDGDEGGADMEIINGDGVATYRVELPPHVG